MNDTPIFKVTTRKRQGIPLASSDPKKARNFNRNHMSVTHGNIIESTSIPSRGSLMHLLHALLALGTFALPVYGVDGMHTPSLIRHDANGISVHTTGADFDFNYARKVIVITQNIPQQRPLAEVTVYPDTWWDDLRTAEAVCTDPSQILLMTSEDGKAVQLASVGMEALLSIKDCSKAEFFWAFTPLHRNAFARTLGESILDENGGISITSLFPSSPTEKYTPYSATSAMFTSATSCSFMLSACPARLRDQRDEHAITIHYTSPIDRYPSDSDLRRFARNANVLQLHSWVWKNRWKASDTTDFGTSPPPVWWDHSWKAIDGQWIPENEGELRRVITTAHELGMKVAPYVNCDPEGIPQHLFTTTARIQELRRLKERFGFDGFYCDGLFLFDPVQSLELARGIRSLVGPDGWISIHSTSTGFPFTDTHANLLITSEHSGFDRWISATTNISNAAASIWPEIPLSHLDPQDFLSSLIDRSLAHGNTFVFLAGTGGQWRDWRIAFSPEELDRSMSHFLSLRRK